MTLAEAFWSGGIHFMTLISLLGVGMVFYTIRSYVKVFVKKQADSRGINYILMFGSLAFICGILGQAIGMFAAFQAIYEAGDVSPGIIFEGIRVSMIAPLYGLILFIFSIPLWMVVRERAKKNN